MDRKLQSLLIKNKVLKTAELQKVLGNRVAIQTLVNLGELIPTRRGFYATPSIDPFSANLIIAAKYYSGLISGLTALVIHGLSDEIINQVDLDIERSTTIRNKIFKVHRVPKHRLVGITKVVFNKVTLKIYDLERTLCEAYLLDPEGPIFFKALKLYFKKTKPNIEIIKKYDTVLKTKVLSHLRQELAE